MQKNTIGRPTAVGTPTPTYVIRQNSTMGTDVKTNDDSSSDTSSTNSKNRTKHTNTTVTALIDVNNGVRKNYTEKAQQHHSNCHQNHLHQPGNESINKSTNVGNINSRKFSYSTPLPSKYNYNQQQQYYSNVQYTQSPYSIPLGNPRTYQSYLIDNNRPSLITTDNKKN